MGRLAWFEGCIAAPFRVIFGLDLDFDLASHRRDRPAIERRDHAGRDLDPQLVSVVLQDNRRADRPR